MLTKCVQRHCGVFGKNLLVVNDFRVEVDDFWSRAVLRGVCNAQGLARHVMEMLDEGMAFRHFSRLLRRVEPSLLVREPLYRNDPAKLRAEPILVGLRLADGQFFLHPAEHGQSFVPLPHGCFEFPPLTGELGLLLLPGLLPLVGPLCPQPNQVVVVRLLRGPGYESLLLASMRRARVEVNRVVIRLE